ncbi:MAG: ATP synthase F1 subunit delta [Cyclobacteriaceae bacterium]|nr:ATP synthase F1 subunit delta [Cyclobacteriaceae bacterium]MCK5467899.1 ATP synthase F1 subunit delta [Cyclobacteriaceae bacterium]MCK5705209.1 ATP synthase F1 subunit delta [Cyclobacteriaceae bacterium]
MSEFRVASRYARSIFDLAIEMKNVDRVYKDMLIVGQVLQENGKLVTLLKNPIIRYDYKLRILNKVFEKHLNELTLRFFNLICRKNRAQILPESSKAFVDLYHEYKGIVRANVSTAVTISAQIRIDFENIISRATGKKVELETKVDESLLGGYVLRIGDNQVDDSLKSKLNNLRRELKSRP